MILFLVHFFTTKGFIHDLLLPRVVNSVIGVIIVASIISVLSGRVVLPVVEGVVEHEPELVPRHVRVGVHHLEAAHIPANTKLRTLE